MYSDDYKFRHHSANREKIGRRFVFRLPNDVNRTFLVNISQFEKFGQLRLCQILLHLSQKGLNVKDYMFYMPKHDIYIEAGDKCQIPFDLFNQKQVFFEMHPLEAELEESKEIAEIGVQQMDEEHPPIDFFKPSPIAHESESQWIQSMVQKDWEEKELTLTKTQSSSPKRTQEVQKSTIEALTKVKQWRTLHEVMNISLKNAASWMGIPKKTLDDYFLTFRVAEFLGYKLQQNLDKKIGHVRTYIRNQPVKVTGRLSKKLKGFSLIPEPDLSRYKVIEDWSKLEYIEEVNASCNSQKSTEMIPE